jgi:2-keto-4-pentenoate hydratase
MTNTYDPRPAAVLIAEAWRTGQQLQELPPEVRPTTLAQGYALQDAMLAQTGERMAGWKLGVGSPAAMRAAKLDRHIHRSGDTVRLPNAAPVTVEFEIAFVMGRSVAPGESLPDPLAAVERMHTTFELVLSRFVNRRAVGWPSFIGDSVGFEALVVGSDITDIKGVGESVVIEVDGKETARGLAGDELQYPVTSFGYLLEHSRARGIALKRGDVATLGAIGKPFDVTGNCDIVARYLGQELRVRIERE